MIMSVSRLRLNLLTQFKNSLVHANSGANKSANYYKSGVNRMSTRSMFDFNHSDLLAKSPPLIGHVKGSDNEMLAYSAYSQESVNACLLFIHGGGAHGQAGYMRMAEQLCSQYKIATYLFDIRGHGKSGGERGHTPTKEQVWDDISSAIIYLKNNYQKVPFYLGGHSSGAGLILNYSNWSKRHSVDGYVMVAPELGHFSQTRRINQNRYSKEFAKVNTSAIISHHISGGKLFGHATAVQFNYSKEQIEQEGLLSSYTVNMSLAVTPLEPALALKKIDKPLQIIASLEDELIDAERLKFFVTPCMKDNPKFNYQVQKEGGHLFILKECHQYIGPFLTSLSNSARDKLLSKL